MKKVNFLFQILFFFLFFVYQSFAENEYCADFQIGEERFFSDNLIANFFGNGTQSYVIKNVELNTYQLTFNIEYYPVNEWNPNQDLDSIDFINSKSEYRSIVKSCFQRFNKYYQDKPIKLILNLTDDHYQGIVPRKIRIKSYKNKLQRNNSREYGFNELSCGTIIHETLHLAGLRDEYTEDIIYKNRWGIFLNNPDKNSEYYNKNAYDCRSLSHSIMGPSDVYFTNVQILEAQETVEPLRPAHIRALLYPGCIRRNKLYYQCIKNVHRTSKEKNGEGCYEVPTECNIINIWLE